MSYKMDLNLRIRRGAFCAAKISRKSLIGLIFVSALLPIFEFEVIVRIMISKFWGFPQSASLVSMEGFALRGLDYNISFR